MSKTNTATVSATAELATLAAREEELKALKREAKAREELTGWETKTKARNPAFVFGSVRKATPENSSHLKHTHGEVCDIKCEACGKTRVVNTQDAFQVRFCLGCKGEAKKAVAKARRVESRLAGRSVADIEAEIKALTAQLATKGEVKAS
jgi:hypothetical protein